MGIDKEGRSIRAETRGRMRGAMMAAAHVLTNAVRMAIRDRPEQCRDRMDDHPTKDDTWIRGQCLEALLDVPRKTVRAHPSSEGNSNMIVRPYGHNHENPDLTRYQNGDPAGVRSAGDETSQKVLKCFGCYRTDSNNLEL